MNPSEFQTVFNFLVGLVSALVGWIMKGMKDDFDNHKRQTADDLKDIRDNYARKDDVKEGFARLERHLDRISAWIENSSGR